MEFNKLADLIAEDSPKAQTYYLAATNLKTGFSQIANDFDVPKYVEKVLLPLVMVPSSHFLRCTMVPIYGSLPKITMSFAM